MNDEDRELALAIEASLKDIRGARPLPSEDSEAGGAGTQPTAPQRVVSSELESKSPARPPLINEPLCKVPPRVIPPKPPAPPPMPHPDAKLVTVIKNGWVTKEWR